MLKHLLFFFVFCFIGMSGNAQEETPVVLLSSKGKIAYQSPGASAKQPVSSGAVFKRAGTVVVPAKCSATLFADGQFKQVQGSKTVSLNSLFPESDGLVRLNFDATFAEYVVAAVSMAANPENARDGWGDVKTTKGTGDGWGDIKSTKGTGDGWGDVKTTKGTGDGWGDIKTTKGSGDGWGGKGNKINAIQPYGKVKAGKFRFHWSKPEGNRKYKVEIKDQDGAVIMETTTQDTFWLVDLIPGRFQEGNRYEWKVTTVGEPVLTSNALIFELNNAAGQGAALQRIEKSPLYQQGSADVRGLMHAISLEREEWYEDAANKYQELQQANPGNRMIRLMSAAFWMRQGLKPMAEKAYKG